MTTKNNGGQILVETCVTLPLQVVLTALAMGVVFWMLALTFVHADAFSLARSTLYGASRACTPSPHWPKLEKLRLEYQCLSPGNVSAHLTFDKIINYQLLVSLR